ncbi:MAG: hypothetical protein ABL882_05515 [Sphingopyxis sp.]
MQDNHRSSPTSLHCPEGEVDESDHWGRAAEPGAAHNKALVGAPLAEAREVGEPAGAWAATRVAR